MNTSRRRFFHTAGAAALPPVLPAAPARTLAFPSLEVSLNGRWEFRLDTERQWRPVDVPHTWQTAEQTAGYLGAAWYRRAFYVPAEWKDRCVRVEFEAVFHSATVWVNQKEVGRHTGKGYTAFEFDLTPYLIPGAANQLEVRVDNSFNPSMLPRNDSYDWTPDGGIYRPVRLLISPPLYASAVSVDAVPNAQRNAAGIRVEVEIINSAAQPASTPLYYRIFEEASGALVGESSVGPIQVGPRETKTVAFAPYNLPRPKLWHFDHPHLYRIVAAAGAHQIESTFGIRKIELRGGALYLNGERVLLAGVERMAGSHPDYGMAEPASWIEHDHADMKELNCVFTRVHWMQDRRVLDYCDRHGILMQLEVPGWGSKTFQGMKDEPSPEIMNNGLEQLREMIRQNRNHPSVFAWGLSNEINGQNPVAKKFIRRMNEEAHRLDPSRFTTYASHSLRTNPGNDVAGELDFISWNEYYESWTKGTVEDMRANLNAIRKAFPGKMIVVSEYGYCECTPDRLGGDRMRIEILKKHNQVFREFPEVGGLIFFCYNDYRTHMGDKGVGVMKQRVHGVVDLYGVRKPSFEELRREASPVEAMEISPEREKWRVRIRTRNAVPAYTLRGYRLRAIAYGFGDLPMEQKEFSLPDLLPGGNASLEVVLASKDTRRVRFEIVRPTGFSAFTAVHEVPRE
jgi:beta-galactosidase